MAPEVEKEVLEYLRDLKKERGDGITLSMVYNAVRSVANDLLEVRKEIAKLRRRGDRHHDRIWALEQPHRAPMPSLSADDSGSFDVSVLGSSAKFTGRLPVRVAMALLIAIALFTGGVAVAMAIGAPRTVPPITGVKP